MPVPLSVSSAALCFLELHPNPNISDLASDGRHICNATLYVMFTVALFAWGLFVNEKQAWRWDGGTAVFGAATLSLALFSSTLYFLDVVKESGYMWLSGLLWTIVVWQSFFGWWWWAGAGGGSALGSLNGKPSLGEMLRQADTRELRKKEKFDKRLRSKLSWRGAFTKINAPAATVPTLERPTHPADTVPPGTPHAATVPAAQSRLLRTVFEWFNVLRNAHRAAAREQNAERAGRIQEMERGANIPLSRLGVQLGDERCDGDGWRDQDRDTEDEEPCGQGSTPQEGDVHHEGGIPESSAETEVVAPNQKSQTLWWWGPLQRWRLRDATSYD